MSSSDHDTHDTHIDAPVPQFDPLDADHDGAQDERGIDYDGDGKVDAKGKAFTAGGYEWIRGKRVAPDPAAPSLEQAVAAEGFFERAGKRVDAAGRAWLRLWQTLAGIGIVGCFALTYYAVVIVKAVAPPAPASQGAVYRLLREARDSRSDLWLVIVADEADAARVEAAMAKDEGGER